MPEYIGNMHYYLRSSEPPLDADMFADLLDQLRSVLAGTTWQEAEGIVHPGEEKGAMPDEPLFSTKMGV